ncbi:hypothetical protein [Neisseria chenwenguii]|uniref:Uncharacterized protein n=1 Tax=Neisseria chenwenguii TaxID=1853278 RepID=A0A220RZF5_9NEIS|nr:hypothetical protein [Neisseria chenwenguii]ASK26496.1 hypothetical protein BG910_00915 [Neisseria chenwenguii]ROV55938.1 pyridoxamine 5'-phosphate oxidase family protein [Neisseria chenwenguii]
MPESIFKQVSLDILRLHQRAVRSLIATQGCTECEVHDAVFVTVEGRYYVWLPCMPSENPTHTGILLIEDEETQARLSWVAETREVKRKDSLYRRATAALQQKMQRTKNRFHQAATNYLLELTPRQGRLTTNNRDLSLSPNDLAKALYPATYKYKLGEFAP